MIVGSHFMSGDSTCSLASASTVLSGQSEKGAAPEFRITIFDEVGREHEARTKRADGKDKERPGHHRRRFMSVLERMLVLRPCRRTP